LLYESHGGKRENPSNILAETEPLTRKELRKVNKILKDKRMRHHIKILTDEYELNVLDKLVNKNSEVYNQEIDDLNNKTKNESTNKSSTNKSRASPVGQFNIRQTQEHKIATLHKGLKVLYDSGSSHTMVKTKWTKHCKHLKGRKSEQEFHTAAGTFKAAGKVVTEFSLPDFNDSKVLSWPCYLDETEAIGYDMIIGRDLMNEIGLSLDFKNKEIIWDDLRLPMRKQGNKDCSINEVVQRTMEPEATQELTERASKILDSKYEKADLREVANKQTHLSKNDQDILHNTLKKYEHLFDGTLGEWNTEPVSFQFKEDVVPPSQTPYSTPRVHRETFRKELRRLCEIGVLKEVRESQWGTPTFIIPKKDGRVRFISDFRKLNQKLKRSPYPLPRIDDTLQQLEGFQYPTALDLNMGYYHIRLDPAAQDACTIVTEFGKFAYQRLPMGVLCPPHIFQSKINEL